jgi:ABC-type branched-subunit amino acid transport system ATPase component
LARVPRVDVVDGAVRGTVPRAAAYLAFGAAQAQALGRALPAAVAGAAQVVLLDEPSAWFGASAKRRSWNALKALRRSLRAAAVE